MDEAVEPEIEEEGTAASAGRTPPYVSFKTFLTLLHELKTNGIPPQIDRSVLSRFAGGIQGQLMGAMKSLRLVDDHNRPTAALPPLVASYESEGFKGSLTQLLYDTYPYVFALDLQNATPAMFSKAFADYSGAKEEVLRKCRTFFLHAAKDADIPLGPRIQNAKFPRSRGSGVRRAKVEKARTAPPPNPIIEPPKPAVLSDKAMEYKLVDLMKEPEVGNIEREAIWTLIQYLTRKSAPNKPEAGHAGVGHE